MRKNFFYTGVSSYGRRLILMFVAGILLLWIGHFAIQPENLPALSLSVISIFFIMGIFAPEIVALLFVLILPLFIMEPFFHGGSAFSVAELSMLSWWSGWLLRKSIKGYIPSPVRDYIDSYILLVILAFFAFTLIVLLSAVTSTVETSLYFTPIFFPALLERFSRIFSNTLQTPESAWRVCLTVIESMVLFLIMIRYGATRQKRQQVLWMVFISSVVVSCIGVAQFFTGWRLLAFWRGQGLFGVRINATFPDVNSCGTFLASTFFVSLSLLQKRKNFQKVNTPGANWLNVVAISGLCLQAVALVLTFSRIALGSFVMAGIIFAWLIFSPPKAPCSLLGLKKMRCLFWIIIISVSLFALFLKVIPENYLNFHKAFPELNTILKGRLNLWRGGLLMWRENPVFGQGAGQFYRLYPLYWDSEAPAWNPRRENAHNYFLQIAAETGLMGEISFILLLGAIFGGVLTRIRDVSTHRTARWRYSAIFCALMVIVLTSLTGHPLLIRELFYFLMILSGVGLAGVQKVNRPAWLEKGVFEFMPETILAFVIIIVVVGSFPFRVYNSANAEKPDYFAVGLHLPEYSATENTWFYWTKQKAIIYMRYLPERIVRFDLKNPLDGGFPITVKMSIGYIPYENLHLNDSEWLKCAAPAYTPTRGYVRVELVCDRVWRPDELNPSLSDKRKLGIMIRFPYYRMTPGLSQPKANEILFTAPAQ